MLAQLEGNHPDDLRVVYRHFPLVTIHDKAALAGQAAELAGEQGAFWPMHDLLYERHEEWTDLAPAEFQEWILDAAEELQLDREQFRNGIETGRFYEEMLQAFARGVNSGIPGTPFLLINGIPYRLPDELNYLEAVVRVEALAARQLPGPPPMELDETATTLAYVDLNIGQLVIQLYVDSAPMAVNSFIYLTEAGWFDGNAFYWIVPGEFVMSGDPTATGFGDPGYHFDSEIDAALTFSEPGLVALASDGPGTHGSRFMITLAAMPEFDGTRTIFGRVVSGLELLMELSPRDPLADLLTPAEAVIEGIVIEVNP